MQLAFYVVVIITIHLVIAVVISAKLYSTYKSNLLRRILSLLDKPLIGLLRSRLYLFSGLLHRFLVIVTSLLALILRIIRSPTIATLKPSNRFRIISSKS